MLLDIRHGLTGEIVMQIEVKSDLSGWEVMNQVAIHQGLMTPYQVIVNPDSVSKRTSPLTLYLSADRMTAAKSRSLHVHCNIQQRHSTID